MKNNMTKKLVLGALFMAMICVITRFTAILIPGSGSGYINAGDAIIYATAVVIGNPLAVIVAGIGSALSDIITPGGAIYWPGTLVIKAVMGLIVGLAYSKKESWKVYLPLMAIASLFMAGAYTAYQYLLYVFFHSGLIQDEVLSPFSPKAMLLESPIVWNLIQAVVGVVLGLPLALQLKRIFRKTSM